MWPSDSADNEDAASQVLEGQMPSNDPTFLNRSVVLRGQSAEVEACPFPMEWKMAEGISVS